MLNYCSNFKDLIINLLLGSSVDDVDVGLRFSSTTPKIATIIIVMPKYT